MNSSASATTATTTAAARRTGRAWKAVAATGVAVVLLAAGGATFAEWSDSQELDNQATITSGTLALETRADGSWTNGAGTDVTDAITVGSYLIVPGDSLTYREQLTVAATGDLLTATVATTLPELGGDAELLAQLSKNTEMTLDGQVVDGFSTQVATSDEAQQLDVALTFAFDAATTGLVAQGQSVDLGALDITLRQNPAVTAGN